MHEILIVEDSATQRQALEALLISLGYGVTAAENGEVAVGYLRRERFDLVISDVIMPGISGFDLSTFIKREPGLANRPPILLLTSMADPRDIVRGLAAGADNYITKPYKHDQLAARIAQALTINDAAVPAGPEVELGIEFLGETFSVRPEPPRILRLLLSSFEDLFRINQELEESRRQVAAAHTRELEQEQRAREDAEATSVRLEQLRQRAEAATRARDDVLAAVSHDLRNPVSTIFSAASLLLEMDLPPETHTRQLEIIKRTALRMDRLIQDLLDVARLDHGALLINASPESLHTVLQEVYEQFQHLAAADSITFRVEKPPSDATIPMDRGRVLQVLSNLIGNALKFTPAGGSVVVSAEISADEVTCSVTDTGPGIPAADLANVFDRFWQGKQKRSAGAGLGLAIALGIVQAHGGRIWATSVEGSGTAFHFALPCEDRSAKAGILPG